MTEGVRGVGPHPNPPCQARGRLSQRERGLVRLGVGQASATQTPESAPPPAQFPPAQCQSLD